ncbi:MAG: phospho-N-acetylmuramoyl-pentapeptide-transferase [Candidatus Absconditicoccaceae bacterium]
MLIKLNYIIIFSLIAVLLSGLLYPIYIKILKKLKVGKTIREETATGEKSVIFTQLHKHKSGTPTMGGGMFLIVMLVMIGLSFVLQEYGLINNTLLSQKETYVILFGFFSMGIIGLVDDYLNVKGHGTIKGLSAKTKLIGMCLFSAFISRWFYSKLGIDYINLWPIAGEISLGIFYPIITFFVTISIVNAINITDGLDGLAGGLMSIVLFVFAVLTFLNQTYIATTVLAILIAVLIAFMFFNINPAKIFMGDSGAFALGGFLASLLYLLNMRIGIFIPFIILFGIFIIEVGSSGLQMFWKKRFKKKLFPMAPLHHLFEHRGIPETTIVMKAWMIQGLLAAITLIAIFYQINTIK